jgi:methanogenic corrinoid protein MtbC1
MDAADRHAIAALAVWFRRQLSAALEGGSRIDAERVIREAVDARLPRQAIYDDVIAVAMHEIGAKWEAGELTVADEHLATSISYGLLALLGELVRVEDERRSELVVLAAVEGERHAMGLRMAGDVLEGAGFPVLFLGADVPTFALLDLLERRLASVCGLSATMPNAREHLDRTIRLIGDHLPRVRVLAGGQAAAGYAALSPTAATVDDVASVVEAADGLLQSASLN